MPPSIVSDRYIQLSPVYRSGPVLEDNTVLGRDRTAAPLELDDIFGSLNQLNKALGPDGANKDGALSDLLAVEREEPRRATARRSTARWSSSPRPSRPSTTTRTSCSA